MLAEQRRRPPNLGWRLREAPGKASDRYLAGRRVLEPLAEVEVLGLGVGKHFRQVEDRPGRYFGGLQRSHGVRRPHRRQVWLEARIQRRAVLQPLGIAGEAAVLQQVGQPERLAETPPVPLVATGDVQPAVDGAE